MADDWKRWLVRARPEQEGGPPGKILKLTSNAVTLLAHDPAWKGVLVYDAFREAVSTTRPPPWDGYYAPVESRAGEWSDVDTSRAQCWLVRHHGVEFSVNVIEQAVAAVAERRIVHPVRDWLSSLEWDKSPRLHHLFVDYFGVEDTPYARGVGIRFAIGAVARVYRPGAKVDNTPVLEGPQGIGKSTGLQKLVGPAWYFDTPITMGDKDGYQSLRGKWVGELGELHSLGRSDLNRAKNFLTATCDTYRQSYARRTRDYLRQCVFVGTTNAYEWLKDETGNRRFQPLRCGRVDFGAIERDREQLWAEARALFEGGHVWHVDSDEFRRDCEVEQEARYITDAWEPIIETWLLNPSHPERRSAGFELGEVLGDCLGLPKDKWTTRDQALVSGILRRLGWERGKQHRVAGRRARHWVPRAVQLVTGAVTSGDSGHSIVESSSYVRVSPVSPDNRYAGTQEPIFGMLESRGATGDGDG